VGLILEGSEPRDVRDGEGSRKLIPSNKLFLVVGHVHGGEECIHEILESLIRIMKLVFRELSNVSDVVETDVVSVHSNVLEEGFHITVGGLVQVVENTVFHLGVVDLLLVSANFLVHLVAEQVLVTEQVLDLALVDWHALLVSVVHCASLVAVSVLEGVVLVITNFGKLFY